MPIGPGGPPRPDRARGAPLSCRLADAAPASPFASAMARLVRVSLHPRPLLPAILPATREGPVVVAPQIPMSWLLPIVPRGWLFEGRHRDLHSSWPGT